MVVRPPSALAAVTRASMLAALADGAADAPVDAAADAAADAAVDGAAADGAAAAAAAAVGAAAGAGADGAAGDGAAGEGAVDAPAVEQAASAMLAITRRPAERVTKRCLDKMSPPCLYVVPIRRPRDPPQPRIDCVDRPPVWPSAGAHARSSRALDSPITEPSRGCTRFVNVV